MNIAELNVTNRWLYHWLSRQVPSMDMQTIGTTGCALGSAIGEVRSENQDRVVFVHYSSNIPVHSFLLFALCDGIGGMHDGRICANMTLAEMIFSLIDNRLNNRGLKEALDLAIKAANEKVFAQYHEQGGTTLSVVALDTISIIGANVGDSRIYQYDKHSLKQISVDDTLEGKMKIKNEFSNNLIQYIGMGKDLIPNFLDISLESGFLLTSDGIHNVNNHILEGILKNAASASDAVKRLIYLSSWLGGKDNASLLFIPNKESIYFLKNLLNETTIDCFLEVWDCFGNTQILLRDSSEISTDLPKKSKKQSRKKSSKKAIKEDKDLQIDSELRKDRSVEKPKLHIEIGKNDDASKIS